MSFFIGLIIGWFGGMIFASIMLAKKNFEKMKKMENNVDDSVNLAKATFQYYNMSPEERAAKEAAEKEAEENEKSSVDA